MVLNLQKKQQLVCQLSKIIQNSLSAVVASLDGVTGHELTGLRAACRSKGVYLCVVRNTLMHRVLSGTVFDSLKSLMVNSNMIAFSTVQSIDGIRIFFQFFKEKEQIGIKGAVFDGNFFDGSKIDILATLPDYNDCIINLIFVLQESCLGKLIRMLYALSRK